MQIHLYTKLGNKFLTVNLIDRFTIEDKLSLPYIKELVRKVEIASRTRKINPKDILISIEM